MMPPLNWKRLISQQRGVFLITAYTDYISKILTGNTTHFDSTDKHYSYGNKGNFGIINNTSIGQYMNKKKSLNAQMNASVIETMSSTDIEVGINDLSQIIPLIRLLIAPVLNAEF